MRESRQQIVDWQWRAVATKNRDLDGVFYFGVRTTGIFCRPSCRSRQPKRENVSFYSTADDARRAGFRAWMRCKPQDANFARPDAELIANALRMLLDEEAEIATVDELAAELTVSAGHLQKTFKNLIGISPK